MGNHDCREAFCMHNYCLAGTIKLIPTDFFVCCYYTHNIFTKATLQSWVWLAILGMSIERGIAATHPSPTGVWGPHFTCLSIESAIPHQTRGTPILCSLHPRRVNCSSNHGWSFRHLGDNNILHNYTSAIYVM